MKFNRKLLMGVLVLLAFWALSAFVLWKIGLLLPLAIGLAGLLILGSSAYALMQAKKLQKIQASYEEGIGSIWTERVVVSFCTLQSIQSAFFYFGHEKFRLLCPQGKTPLDLTLPLSDVVEVVQDENNPDLLHITLTGNREYSIASADDKEKIVSFLTGGTD